MMTTANNEGGSAGAPRGEVAKFDQKALLGELEKLADVVSLLRRLVFGLALFAGVLLVVMAAVQWQVLDRNEEIEDISAAVNRMESNITHTDEAVEDLGAFVEELREETPEEQALNTAIRLAVAEVPSIKAILCEAFPSTDPCTTQG